MKVLKYYKSNRIIEIMKKFSLVALISCLMFTGCTSIKTTDSSKKKVSDMNMKDIDYQGSPALKMDAYLPEKGKNNTPIILVHGGGFENGDKSQDLYEKMSKAFANKGYAAFCINYTLVKLSETTPDDARIGAVKDVMTAISYIKKHSKDYQINPDKIILLGDSAGGAIVVYTALEYGKLSGIAACIDLWGGMPVNSVDNTPWGGDVYAKAINANKAVPFLIMHGTGDSVAGYNVSERLSAQLSEKDIKNKLIPLENAEHYPENLGDTIINNILTFLGESKY
jgi:acetyl esterase/lipase